MKRVSIGGADLDAETLQTDVMRFMAIMAFCLMAILALVRNVDSVPTPAPPVPERKEVARAAPPPVQVPRVERKVEALPAPKPVLEPPPKIEEAPKVELAEPARPPPQPLAKLEPPPVMPAPPRPSPPVAVPPPAAPKAEGLMLRFASDMDFLKLVSNRTIEVYAYDAGTAFKLSPGFAFETSARPPQVHELLNETIPSLVRKALSRTVGGEVGALLWGVHLPPNIESNIEKHLAQQRTGVLLIDRYGTVRHESSSG